MSYSERRAMFPLARPSKEALAEHRYLGGAKPVAREPLLVDPARFPPEGDDDD